jgi:hypothetical protein
VQPEHASDTGTDDSGKQKTTLQDEDNNCLICTPAPPGSVDAMRPYEAMNTAQLRRELAKRGVSLGAGQMHDERTGLLALLMQIDDEDSYLV